MVNKRVAINPNCSVLARLEVCKNVIGLIQMTKSGGSVKATEGASSLSNINSTQ
jgi:hypothetical protein